jgi:hypothetical protein
VLLHWRGPDHLLRWLPAAEDRMGLIDFYEPSPLEIWLALALGLIVLSPYCRSFGRSLNLNGGVDNSQIEGANDRDRFREEHRYS